MMNNHSHLNDVQDVVKQTEFDWTSSSYAIIEEDDTMNATSSTIHPIMLMSKVLNNITAMVTAIVNTAADVPYEDYKYRPETYIVPLIFGIIFIAGLTGNGMLIAVFIKHRAMRNVPNT